MNDPGDIRNWLRLSRRITTSGRLDPDDPQRLAAIGVRRVINLAMPDHPEALENADGLMQQAGLRYTHIPVPFDAPSDDDYRAFVAALEEDEAPVHVHCIMNYRVSAFFYRYHVESGSMGEREARELLEQVWQPHGAQEPAATAWRAFVEGVGQA